MADVRSTQGGFPASMPKLMGDPHPGIRWPIFQPARSRLSVAEAMRSCRAPQHTFPPVICGLAWGASRKLAFVLSVCSLSFGACVPSRCADFELSGRSTIESFKPDGSTYKTFLGRFSVQKSGEKWLIVCSPDAVRTTEHVMFDGVDVYTLTRNIVVQKNDIARFPGSKNDFAFTNGATYAKAATAAVFSGDYPLGAQPTARLLWLALLSGSSLSKTEAPRIPAPWGASFMPESRSFTLRVDWPTPNSEFPAKTAFIASSELWTNSFREWTLSSKVTAPSPFEDKTAAGVYQVVQWSKVDNGKENLVFPLEFAVERFFPAQLKGRPTVAERYRCEVTNVALNQSIISRIELGDNVNVIDYRFMDETLPWFYVVYPITEGAWKTTNDPAVRASIESFRTKFIKTHAMPSRLRSPDALPAPYARITIVLVLLSGPIIALLVWIRKIVNRKSDKTL